mmetsp:Transcript_18634/g.37547  ORF Transcript_18634/g.37547 Transcript_18634/m.37547 type:complete len:233 (+) Transcript_18634:1830-2528(+)
MTPSHGEEEGLENFRAYREEAELTRYQQYFPFAGEGVPCEKHVSDVQAFEQHLERETDVGNGLIGRRRPKSHCAPQNVQFHFERPGRRSRNLGANVLHVPFDGRGHDVGRSGQSVQLGQIGSKRREVGIGRQEAKDARSVKRGEGFVFFLLFAVFLPLFAGGEEFFVDREAGPVLLSAEGVGEDEVVNARHFVFSGGEDEVGSLGVAELRKADVEGLIRVIFLGVTSSNDRF